MASLNWGDDKVPGFIWKHISPEPNSDCWFWTGCVGHGGPTYFHKPSKLRMTVRRLAYAAAFGSFAKSKRLRDTCGNERCCNPCHMRLGAREQRPVRDGYHRDWRLRTQYGITEQDFARMLDEQDGRCAICGDRFGNDLTNGPKIDHCHSTGRVRGLLCLVCNTGLGSFKDSKQRLLSAIAYLDEE